MENKNLIPFFGLHRQYNKIKDEILDATCRVYETGQVLDGIYTEIFETLIAKKCHRKFAIAVNSGTQALIFSQNVLFHNRDKPYILIPSLSFIATLNSVLMSQHEPTFCDVDDNGLLDIESLDYALKGSLIGGVTYVNIFGNILDYDRLKLNLDFFGNSVPLIEDAAQSFGASYKGIPSGKLGDISVLSFDPTKNLPNYGSGGMILTDDEEIYQNILILRNNGKYLDHSYPGTNSKMNEADCAQLIVKLGHFDNWQRRRNEIAYYYSRELEDLVDTPQVNEHVVHAWHKYVIRTGDRYRLQHRLKEQGIETKIHYEKALFDYPVGFNFVKHASELYRNASAFSAECLSLPIYPELEDIEVELIVDTIKNYIS